MTALRARTYLRARREDRATDALVGVLRWIATRNPSPVQVADLLAMLPHDARSADLRVMLALRAMGDSWQRGTGKTTQEGK